MSDNKKSKLFELLLKNDKNELKKLILSEGKGPKPVCPIRFMNKEEKENEENE